MSETTESLRKKIDRANELQSVVRTMKTLAASNIGQYEKSVSALSDYYRTVEMGLEVCFREIALSFPAERPMQKNSGYVAAVVFGSDQGLVGQFNDIIADYAVKKLADLPGKARVWAVGERVYSRLNEAGLPLIGLFTVPNSVKGITPLIGQILVENEKLRSQDENAELYLFYNRHKTRATYEPVSQRLLPLDETWRRDLAKIPWPTKNLPELMGDSTETLGRHWEHLSANIFSFRFSGHVPNPLQVKMQAVWQRCSVLTKISMNCWKISEGHFIACARVELTKNCLK